jgi:tetratricopeptide (TPR) repeat protein
MDAGLRSAYFYWRRDEPERGRKVLSAFESTGDARVLTTLAWLDSRLGQRDLALAEYRRAVEASRHVVDSDVRADAITTFGFELYRASNYEEAVRLLDGLVRAQAGTLTLRTERNARLNLARSLQEMGDAPAAEAELQRLKTLLGNVPLSSIELMFDARLHLEAGQLRSADELLEQAQLAARREGSRLYEAFAVIRRLEIAVKEADRKRMRELSAEAEALADVLEVDERRQLAFAEEAAARAEGRLEESRTLLEKVRGMSPPPNERWELAYEWGLTLRAQGHLKEARQAFQDSISEVELQRKQLVDPSFQAALSSSRERPYDALVDLFAEAREAEGALSTLQGFLASRLDEDVSTAARSTVLEASDALKQSAARRELAEVSRKLPERPLNERARDVRFVAFVTTETHSWALLRYGGRTVVLPVEASPKELCALMQRFGDDFDDEAAARLGSLLFPPSTLAQLGQRFAVILPACARSFPVAAVRIGEGRLIDQAVVSVAPDVSTITRPGSEDPRETGHTGLALGDPLGDLPAAREEAESTGRLTGAGVRLGHFASGATLEQSGTRVLHFATHTVVDVAGPALVLADGNLSVADILRRRLHADLVVLASCHSGSRLAATAADTLSTAFLRAGSGAVLATLRSVEDPFASAVVRAFYEQGGLDDPAGALARVQRQLLRTEPASRWSAFFVAGSPEPGPRVAAPHRAQAAYGG